ncbi:MAG TPA: LPS export ABC transporter permease LptF [Xanthobacteraceae bacterium]|nr:LPS export ABC transporter permease LptF [Xanthobacteraceae bacterium]
MGSIGRYIFRTTLGAFLVVLISVTALMWITQALRDFDLMTNEGQGILTFVGVTGLIIPLLVMIIAPTSFMVAMAYVLHKLATDSELIVMNAAGMRPWHLFRPFLAVAIIVSLLVAVIAAYLSPKCLRELSRWISQIRADLVTQIVQPGRFVPLYSGALTLHIRERLPNGQLLGIFIDDQRDPKERVTFLAEQGDIITRDGGTYLLLADGSVQRQESGDHDPSIVQFDRYAFDLSQLSPQSGSSPQKYSSRERYIWELYTQDPNDPSIDGRPEQMRAELHDRITAPLYPLVIAVLTFAYLGAPRTTRQGRTLSLLSAIGAVVVLRALGFVGVLAGTHVAAALFIPYVALAVAFAFGYWGISRGLVFEPPAIIVDRVAAIMQRFSDRMARATG